MGVRPEARTTLAEQRETSLDIIGLTLIVLLIPIMARLVGFV